MKKDRLTKAIDLTIEKKLKAVDRFIEETIEPIENVGSPESLIGKKYEEWTPIDLQLLSQVYGEGDDTPLAKLIASKSIERVTDLENQVKALEGV